MNGQDQQDKQDKQEERLLRESPSRVMIRCGYAGAHYCKTPDSQDQILCILYIHELFAKFVAGQVILPANRRFCHFQWRVRPGENCFLTTKSTKGTNCVFVPFVAIPGKRLAAEFCKRLPC